MLGGFDRYNKGGGAERAAYLSCWSLETIQVDRKTGDRRSLRVPKPHLSIFGGIQPDLLHSVIDDKDVASGLPARFLWCHPPQRQQRWIYNDDIKKNHTKAYQQTFEFLYAMTPNINEVGVIAPVPLQLTNEARRVFGEFCDRNHVRAVDLQGSFSGPWAKLRGYCGRLALVLHCLRGAEGSLSAGFEHQVDADTMRAAVTLTEWFGNEAERIFSMRSESPEDRKMRELVAWIECKGGEVTVRELSRGPRQYRSSQVAEAMLQSLVAKGYGRWKEGPALPQGGRPTRLFKLIDPTISSGDGDETHINPEKMASFVTVAGNVDPIPAPKADHLGDDSTMIIDGIDLSKDCYPLTAQGS